VVLTRILYSNEAAIYEGARLAGREGREGSFVTELEGALWVGDIDRIQELASCGCCCDEHFFEDCPARVWGGCRGQHSMTRSDREEWVEHYRLYHGMTRDQFFGTEGLFQE